ncbi:putative alpha-1,2-mannosidase [Anseongella ginsenosidimutans]|uniref:Putative alpha-1,2-mannosidase n=1 Tax=Anseongella ginsenosidimutans TaxID=496056 RepID=A0A4R3KNG5_9SPHI|nr:GH92 family glycosyl hydrolase [Anseongella ginsenosidimutans]QEC53696.1 glycoside hydrolase family 92 protein [Anseongella ginsenosidimutans]TCS86055.1 putative alpha-1,2-mannosidase [Anseongella ginsenosidimutans]
MNGTFRAFALIFLYMGSSCSQAQQTKQDYTQYVNTFIGTAPLTDPDFIGYTPPEGWRVWAGLTYPGSSLPNAMVQLSPVTEYGTGAGYQYEDGEIIGFTHTNKGHWNLCNIPILPLSGDARFPYASSFSHDQERASPAYYEVFLEDYKVNARLSSTLRCGIHEYTWEDPAAGRRILFDLGKANNRVSDWEINTVSANELEGFQRVGNDKIHFYVRLSQPVEDLEVVRMGERDGYAIVKLAGGGKAAGEENQDTEDPGTEGPVEEAAGEETANEKDLAGKEGSGAQNGPVLLKIGLSYVSAVNAAENLREEIGSKSFEDIHSEGREAWNALLLKIAIKGGTEKQKELFYSSLYRSFLWPALRSDINGQFRDVKGKVQQEDFNYYTNPSFWDTYRNKLVLLSIVSPRVTEDVIKSLIDKGEKTGFIPTFFHGDHAAAFIAGTYLRGSRGFDAEKAFGLLLNNAYKEGGSRPYISEYIEKGYISDPDVEHPHVETKGKAGVSKTLEYAYDDYSLALLAAALDDTLHYRELMDRSGNYRNVFDTRVNFMRGKLENGAWIQPFNPEYPYYEYMYREASAWQVSFYVPHDMPGLIELYGGKEAFEAKLDSLFTLPWNPDYIARNVSSFLGQYSQGNQPDHEAPFAYYFIGKPAKSQRVIDTLLENYYGVGEEELALPGMDDAGEMSSWYVFASLGLYPYSPADPEYLVSVPVFDEVAWKLENGKSVIIRKSGKSRKMSRILVNGKENEGYFIPHDLFLKGGTIEVQTAPRN